MLEIFVDQAKQAAASSAASAIGSTALDDITSNSYATFELRQSRRNTLKSNATHRYASMINCVKSLYLFNRMVNGGTLRSVASRKSLPATSNAAASMHPGGATGTVPRNYAMVSNSRQPPR